jgi:hypothetical protein
MEKEGGGDREIGQNPFSFGVVQTLSSAVFFSVAN